MVYQLIIRNTNMEEIKIIFFVILTIMTYLQAKKINHHPAISNNKHLKQIVEIQNKRQENQQIDCLKQDQKVHEFTIEEIVDMDKQIYQQFQEKVHKMKGSNKKGKEVKKVLDESIDSKFEMNRYCKGMTFDLQYSRIMYDANYFNRNPFQKEQGFNNFNFYSSETPIRTNAQYLSKIQHILKPFQEERYNDKMNLNQSMCIETNNTSINQMIDQSIGNILDQQSIDDDQCQNLEKSKTKKKSIKKKKNLCKNRKEQTKSSALFLNSNKMSFKKQTKFYKKSTKNENMLDLQQQIQKRELELMILKNIKMSRSNRSNN